MKITRPNVAPRVGLGLSTSCKSDTNQQKDDVQREKNQQKDDVQREKKDVFISG